jgi:thiol-disulfide isomerase/thioredoxin
MKIFLLNITLLFLFSCRQNITGICRIVVRISGTSADSVLLRRISLNSDPSRTIDSGVLFYSRDSVIFKVPVSSDSLYQISLKFSRNKLYCIPDNDYIRIVMNMKNGKNSITGSPASASLLQFSEEQDSLIRLSQMARIKSIITDNRMNTQRLDSFQQVLAGMYKNIQQRYYDFGDSVSSSAAFMENYDHIEFRHDTGRMRNLVTNAAGRFPNSASVLRLKKQVLNLIHIYEKELQIGDRFPELRLPDLDGHLYSTNEVSRKYIFIDFWSSWCRNCMAYFKVKKELTEDSRFENLALISVAMDNNLEFCREAVKENHLKGIQLIDKDIWQGQTAEKIAFDSIPFNFLIGPDQRILAKAIPADSVLPLLQKYIH